jgi:hypothetical protein
LDWQERNHLSKAKEQSDGILRMTTAWYTQSSWKMPCTDQHSRHVCCVLDIGANPWTITSWLETEHGKPLTPITSSYIGTSADSKGQFHGMQAQIQDTYRLPQVPLTTESILPQSMQTTTLSDMNVFASTHTQMALTLFPMTSRMRIQQ